MNDAQNIVTANTAFHANDLTLLSCSTKIKTFVDSEAHLFVSDFLFFALLHSVSAFEK
jgi:hypothetical protein